MELGWAEMLVIGVIALIVLGEDLPSVFRQLGRFTGKMRRMAREFQRAMEDAADEAGVKETARDLKSMTSPSKMGLDRLKEAADSFEKWDPSKPSEKAKSIGDETAKLAEQRAETVRKARENAEKYAADRRAAEEAAKEAADAPAPKPDETA